ncbi:NADH-quinone oxidoreductase subunit C [Bdellovibrionota bacterium FG-2]
MDVRTPIPTNGGEAIKKFGEAWRKQIALLQVKFSADLKKVLFPGEAATDFPIIYVSKDKLIEILKFLKKEAGFEYDFLADLTATDEELVPRFELVYNLFSTTHKHRIRVKVAVHEGEDVPTAISVWPGANWAEREVYDMFGIKFQGHPDLRRLLMDYRYVGHPLRKDFPLRGYQLFTEPQEIDPKLLD